jgi:hypothetical protein
VIESVDLTRSDAAAAVDSDDPEESAADPSAAGAPFERHVSQRTVVLPDLRVVFLPVPKAGCTTVLWLLAEMAGIPTDNFAQSPLPEVSPALTVHDMRFWTGNRLSDYEGPEREEMLTDDGWFRFATVRHPATRVWSAWQSKLLLREPRFVEAFGEEPWFPRLPTEPDGLIEDFRRFVKALASGGVEDVHWSVQHDLVRQLPLTHVGHVEQLGDTLTLLRRHVPADRWPTTPSRQNRAPLPVPAGAYDEEATQVLHERYRADFEEFGYDKAATSDGMEAAEWEKLVGALLPALRESVDKHARIGELHRVARRVQPLEKQLETASVREGRRASAPLLTNLERYTEFNVRWSWADGRLEPGFTAVVRVKDEARWLPWVLPPLFRAVERVVLVDNGSSDGSAGVARDVAKELGAAERLAVLEYPFSVARCGQEHLDMLPNSVHSLAYFYNWSFSHVGTTYALKWDGDMLLTDHAVGVLRDLAWQLEASEAVVKIPRYPVYVADERRAYFDVGMRNTEPWAWPNLPGYSFVKAMEWELPLWPRDVPTVILPAWSCLELKDLGADEFDHWTNTDYDASPRQARKRREVAVFTALAEGRDPPADVLPIEAPSGQHVIEYVRSSWLPGQVAEWSENRGLLAALLS